MSLGVDAELKKGDLQSGAMSIHPIKGKAYKPDKFAVLPDNPEEKHSTSELRDAASDLKDKPTTANATKGTKDLPSAVSQVGNAAAFLPNMYSMMSMISAMVSGKSQASRKSTIEDSLSGALAILANKWGYDKVITVFDNALSGDKIKIIDENYRTIVKNALANLYKAVVQYGPNNIPIYTYSTVTTIGPVPSPLVTTVPDLYLQQYYLQSEDPYPGYVRWNSQDGTEYVFTERKIGDKYYSSPQEEIYSISEQELAESLDPYIENENLTAEILNNLLLEQDTNIEANTKDKTLGKGSGSGGANALRLLLSLLGYIAQTTNSQKSRQLPYSILNSGSITESLTKFEKNEADAKKIAENTKKSVQTSDSSLTIPLSTLAPGVIFPETLKG